MEALDATNAALKTRGVKGRIVVAKDLSSYVARSLLPMERERIGASPSG